MNWQANKSRGDPIYIMEDAGPSIFMYRAHRVVYTEGLILNEFGKLEVLRKVRFSLRWHILHSPDSIRKLYKGPNGEMLPVLLNWKEIQGDEDKLPFICSWENTGILYEPYGY